MRTRVLSVASEGFFLLATVFGPLAFGAVEPWSRGVLLAIVFLSFGSQLLYRRGSAQPADRTLLVGALVVLSVGLTQLMTPRGIDVPSVLSPFTASEHATGREVILWSGYAALLWSAPWILSSPEARCRFAWTLFCLGAFIAVVGIAQRSQGNTAYYGLRPVRAGLPFGPYANRSHAASMLVMSFLFGMGLFCEAWRDSRAYRHSRGFADWTALQVMTGFLLTLIAYALLTSLSRGALNSLVASTVIILTLYAGHLSSSRARVIIRAAAAGSLVAYLLYIWFNPILIGNILTSPDISTAIRVSMYKGAFRMLADFPVWGVGLGALQRAYPPYQDVFVNRIVDHVHSDWLELPLQIGIPAALTTATALCVFLMRAVRAWLGARPIAARRLLGGGLAAAVAFLFQEAVDFSFHIPANAVIFLGVLSFLSAATKMTTESGASGASS